MASLPHSKTISYEEWLRRPEDSEGCEEVVNGEIRLMSRARWKHALIVQRLSAVIASQLPDRLTLVLTTSFGLVIRKSPLTSRVPDVAVFDAASIVEEDGYVHSAPQLIAEVLSPGNTRREREEKPGDYAALGVPEVWVVSSETRTVEVLMLDNGLLRRAGIFAEGFLTPRHFPHVQVDIAAIWPD